MLKRKRMAPDIKVKIFDHGQCVYKDSGERKKVKKNLFSYFNEK